MHPLSTRVRDRVSAFRALTFGAVVIALTHTPVGADVSPLATDARAMLPAADPGRARAMVTGDVITLSNGALEARWSVAGGALRPASFRDKWTRSTTMLSGEVFSLVFPDGKAIGASSLRIVRAPKADALPVDRRASRYAQRLPGRGVSALLEDPAGAFQVEWRAVLRESSNTVRQEITVTPKADLPVKEVVMLEGAFPGARTVGTVDGSPIVAGDLFLGLEHPMARNTVKDGIVRCSLARELPVKAGQSLTASSIIGVAPLGQMRRAVNYYVERERAHPYRPFLHYNSWYDIGYFSKFNEAAALDVINAYGRELHDRRGVALSSFLFDDGWDDPKTLWHFNDGFPNGFTPLKEATAKIGAAPGVWVSPWGGYGDPREERLKYGKAQGFETNEDGFALSGPTYYQRFRDTCLDMIRSYGVNQFKIDGTGGTGVVQPGSPFGSDFEAAIHLIGELRAEKPDLFVNLTTGTWPSPFWLQYADTIYRGGWDHSFAGVGSDRQKWITYRDADTYERVVLGGPLFPLTSLMLHGLIYARHADKLSTDPKGEFVSEIRDYFGTGTQLQEMYVTPSLLTKRDWDALAEAANWSRRNAGVLVDTHWIGGSPGKLEPYGWAAWSREKGILTLRNPDEKPREIGIDPLTAFELPPDAPSEYTARSPWREDRRGPSYRLCARERTIFHLAPFQVLTLEAVPAK